MNLKEENSLQHEKLTQMQKIKEKMQEEFFNTESTSEFLKKIREHIDDVIQSDF